TTPMMLLLLYASRIGLMDLSRPTVMGIITPGNNTVFRNGRIGKMSGTGSLLISSSSSLDIKGKNSVSSVMKNEGIWSKLSNINNPDLLPQWQCTPLRMYKRECFNSHANPGSNRRK